MNAFDPIISVPEVTVEEAQAKAQARRDMLDAANPFSSGYTRSVPRPANPSEQNANGSGRETWIVPLPTFAPLASSEPPIAKPAAPSAPRPRKKPEPKALRPQVKPAGLGRGEDVVLVRRDGAWADLHRGLIVSNEVMDLVTRLYVGQKKRIADIAKETDLDQPLIKAILRTNRVPVLRQGRGPAVRPAAPRR